MEKRTKVALSFGVLIALVFGLYFFTDWFSKTTGFLIENEEEESSLARCLTGKNVVFYGSRKCADCKKQIDFFGNGFRYLNYVECNGHPGKCQELKIVPAWEINGQMVYGLKSLSELRVLSGCS